MNKNIGFLVSLAIGDAFGRSFEFGTKENIDKHFDINVYPPGVGKFPEDYKGGVGKYTDDTQMTIGIIEHMIMDYPITHNYYASCFLDAYNKDKRISYSKSTNSCVTTRRVVTAINNKKF